MKEDLRYRRTEAAIRDAVIEALTCKSVEKITVTELCERAMISRKAFYDHYADLHSLLEGLCDDLVSGVPAELLDASDPDSIRALLEMMMAFLKETLEHAQGGNLLPCNSDYLFRNVIYLVFRRMSALGAKGGPDAPYRVEFIASGLAGAYRRWHSARGMSYDAFLDLAYDLVEGVLAIGAGEARAG